MDKKEALVTPPSSPTLPTSPISPASPDPPPAYQASIPTRLVLCVDGSKYEPNSDTGETTIHRIFTGIRKGQCVDNVSGGIYKQNPKYIPAIAGGAVDEVSFNRLQIALPGYGYHQQIQDIYEECCKLTGDHDEVVLFGFSKSAYVIRAAAGLLHQCGALASAGKQSFARDYKKLLKQTGMVLSKPSQHGDGTLLSPTLTLSQTASRSSSLTGWSAECRPGPLIRFVGVLDTVNALNDGSAFDISFNSSIQHLRHALAIHEQKKALTAEPIYPDDFDSARLTRERRSFVQAWFVGTHTDIGGVSPKGGLGLYPLQWMVLEAISCGVAFDLSPSDRPLSVAFPQFGGDGKPVKKVSFKGSNGLKVALQDLKWVHDERVFKGAYGISLTNGRSHSVRMRKPRTPFDSEGHLLGYCDDAPLGTIMHPSVYLLLDEHIHLALDTKEAKLQRDIEDYRERILGSNNGVLANFSFGRHNDALDDAPPDPGAIRVLVCGNTGVGKSTLINKTFGVDVTQSSDRTRGIHDVKQEITWEGRQDLIVHDSGGFEAGADDEFIAIEEFLKAKSTVPEVEDRLHVIWFCIEINSARTLQTATEKLFRAVSTYASEVPIVVVATKKDDLLDLEFSKRRKELKKLKQPFDEDACEEYAEEQLKKRLDQIREEMETVPGGRLDALVAVSQDDDSSISELSQTTSQCLDTDKVRSLYIRAQVSRIDLKVDLACAEVIRRYKALVRTATGVSFTVIGPSATRHSAAVNVCKAILNCFGLPSVSADMALAALKETVWNHLGFDITIAISECINTLGFVGSGFTVGIPIYLLTGAISAPMVVPSTCRLFLTMACDLILVLARSFKEVAFRAGGQPAEHDVQAAARLYRIKGYSEHVHQDVRKLTPRYNLSAAYKYNKVQKGVETIFETYKDGLMENVELPFNVTRTDREIPDFDAENDDGTEDGTTLFKELRMANRNIAELEASERNQIAELAERSRVELEAREQRVELDGSATAIIEMESPNVIPHRGTLANLFPTYQAL